MSPDDPRRHAERLTIHLQELIRGGRGDEILADGIRESLTEELARLPADERRLLTSLAGDLYMLAGEECLAPEQSVLEIRDAWHARDWKRLLALLAHHVPGMGAHYRAYLRGRAWGELGYRRAAVQFLRHAWSLQAENDNYGYLTVQAILDAEDFEEAWAIAGKLLADDRTSVTLLYKVADVLYAGAHRSGPPIEERLYRRVIEVVDRARALPTKPSVPSVVIGGLVKKAFSLANLENVEDAESALTAALGVDHESDIVLAARGLLRLDSGRVSDAIVDFTRAADKGSVLVWPFFYLAKHAVQRGDHERCLDLVAAALPRARDSRMRANLFEWNAIALRALNRDDEARQSAEEAQLLEPFNERISKNVDAINRRVPPAELEVVADLSTREAMRLAA
jgi:tetratricopeptide (TPR) repeat protein